MEGVAVEKPRAVIVGGSIAGVSCAHALNSAGWDTVVLEKSSAPPTRSPTGAGLGLDPISRQIIQSWLHQSVQQITLPLSVDQNVATDRETKESWTLTRDEGFNFRAAYWADLHCLMQSALPPDTIKWGHLFVSFSSSSSSSSSTGGCSNNAAVKVKARLLQTDETVEITGDLLVAADGCLSSIRHSFLPELKLRYSGYCAWRGVVDFSGEEDSVFQQIKKAYPDLGKCLYFDLSSGTHSVLYELMNQRLNWIWYVNQPEPELKGNSMTMKVSMEMIDKMRKEAEQVWRPELAQLMKETKEPFINVMYDCDPLEKIFWDNVVLVGDAAHPTTPHGLRSTNMSIVDAAVLASCLNKWGPGNLASALLEYQELRVPVTSQQVLYSRRLGRIKQGLPLDSREGKAFDPKTSSPLEWEELLQQKNMPFFSDLPISGDAL